MFGLQWRRTSPSPTVAILADEFAQIHGRDPAAYMSYAASISATGAAAHALRVHDPETQYVALDKAIEAGSRALVQDFHRVRRKALCLSGGGIRSAAFGLGVLEWLTQNNVLDKFHYLSTVSGGGYIGSWLSTWIAKEEAGWSTVRARLSIRAAMGEEPQEIRHLRENSRYLTQKSGLISGDTWAAVAIWLRNLMLNWVLILPLIAAVALVPKIFLASMLQITGQGVCGPCAFLAAGSYAIAVLVLAHNRPRWSRRNLERGQYLWMYQLPFLVAAAAWTVSVIDAPTRPTGVWSFAFYGVGTGVCYAVAWGLAIAAWRWGPGRPLVFVSPKYTHQHPPGRLNYEIWLSKPSRKHVQVCAFTEDRQAVEAIHFDQHQQVLTFAPGEHTKPFEVILKKQEGDPYSIDGRPIATDDIRVLLRQEKGARIARTPWIGEAWVDIACAGARGVTVGVLLAALHVYLSGLAADKGAITPLFDAVLFGVPLVLGAHLIGTIVFIGLNNKTPKSEDDREWHGRLDGFAIAAGLVWMIWVLLAIVGPDTIVWLFGDGAKGGTKAVAFFGTLTSAAGTLTAWLGQGSGSPATAEARATDWKAKLVLPIAGTIFVVCLFVLISLALDEMKFGRSFLTEGRARIHREPGTLATSLALLCASLVTAPCILAYFINVNRFSLHAIYRNRLVRAFLGASEDWYKKAWQNRYTGFNDSDNIEMQRLWDRRAGGPHNWRPFHVINMALNVTSGPNLALQDRKALPFVATPLWCGAANLDDDRGAFRRTSEFGGEQKTMTVGTAMAISGAAVSPNMGYHSSPLISLILTFFNVRLGWWYGNPINEETYRLEGPRWALKSLIYEALGLTNETRPYVYLSDGGHFDNLGLYEMVRRRCHMILVIDAGQDRECQFTDLASTVARIMTDFGIPIRLDLKGIRTRNDNRQSPDDGGVGFSIGSIEYKAVDGAQASNGEIVYVKPSFRSDEPVSILGYAAQHEGFPHEPTADQWFSEAQFESYRALGFEAMRRVGLNNLKKLEICCS